MKKRAICGFLVEKHLQFSEYFLMHTQEQRFSPYCAMGCKKTLKVLKVLHYSHVIMKKGLGW